MTTTGVCTLLLGCGVALGCAPRPTLVIERNRAELVEPTGAYAFYSGQGIGDLIAQGAMISDDIATPFMRLRVSASFVDSAAQSVPRIRTVSFEVPDPTIEATVHYYVRGSAVATTSYFHPGDPWVTGLAQVGTGPDGITVGLFQVTRWNKGPPSMPGLLVQEVHTTGLFPDDNAPTLKYANNPIGMALPDNWK